MTPQEVERMLRQTLEDRRLSGGERRALGEALAAARPDAQQAAVYRNLAFRLAGEAIDDLKAREVLDWVEDVVKLIHPVRQEGGAVLSQALFAPGDNLAGRICQLFDAARRSVDVCVFTITDDRISDAIVRAHRRGVAVRVISDNDKALDLGSDLAHLTDAGLNVRLDRTTAHMHHKFAVYDAGLLLNGSYNWTRSAGVVNCENLVVTSDAHLVLAFARHFEQLWHTLGD